MKFGEIARICHEVNRGYCASIGDDSQVPWEDAPQWQRDSALDGVWAVRKHGPDPQRSHESWLAEKKKTGWVWGLNKDAEKKTHPSIMPYDRLPAKEQLKDALFAAVCVGLMGRDD